MGVKRGTSKKNTYVYILIFVFNPPPKEKNITHTHTLPPKSVYLTGWSIRMRYTAWSHLSIGRGSWRTRDGPYQDRPPPSREGVPSPRRGNEAHKRTGMFVVCGVMKSLDVAGSLREPIVDLRTRPST